MRWYCNRLNLFGNDRNANLIHIVLSAVILVLIAYICIPAGINSIFGRNYYAI